ncbi:hypothetical protein FAVG1_12838 [Fusarium avenaceum]|nr:hypothetical protein FAVG1_12838 [Fusarium avenaceum]
MCPSNSSSLICGHSLDDYLKQEQKVKHVLVHFCASIRGTILQAHLELATPPKPSIAAYLIDPAQPHLNTLLQHCKLHFGSSWNFQRVIIRAFKNTVRWMERRLVDYGVLLQTAEGLKRADGYVFESDEVAGEWFHGMFEKKRVAGRLDDITAGLESMELAESQKRDPPNKKARVGNNRGKMSAKVLSNSLKVHVGRVTKMRSDGSKRDKLSCEKGRSGMRERKKKEAIILSLDGRHDKAPKRSRLMSKEKGEK